MWSIALSQCLQKEPTLLTAIFQTSSIQNCKTIDFWCFKPPNVWHLVTAALGNKYHFLWYAQFNSVQLLNSVWLLVTPWITARQASLSITNSRSSLRLMSIKSVIPSSHLILCRPLLLPPPIPPSIRVFSNESALHMRWPKYWNFSFSIIPSKEIPGLISFRLDWLDLLAVQGTLKNLLQHHSSKAITPLVYWGRKSDIKLYIYLFLIDLSVYYNSVCMFTLGYPGLNWKCSCTLWIECFKRNLELLPRSPNIKKTGGWEQLSNLDQLGILFKAKETHQM